MRVIGCLLAFSMIAGAQQVAPVWWAKYQYLSQNAADKPAGKTKSQIVGSNVDVSNECGPQHADCEQSPRLRKPATLAAAAGRVIR